LGLILAAGTAIAVFVLLRGMGGVETTVEVETVKVVVAKQPIGADEPVEGRIKLEDRPAGMFPPGSYRRLDAVSGMVAAGPIPQGAVLHPDSVLSPQELAAEGRLGKLVEEGFVAVAFPINEMSSVSYGVKRGDHVDILVTFHLIDLDQETQTKGPLCPPLCPGPEGQRVAATGPQYPRMVTQLTVQNAEVLGVGRWAYKPKPQEEQVQGEEQQPQVSLIPIHVTLMVSPQDALVLKLAREIGADIDLAVRAEEDIQVFSTQEVTLDYVMARFGINLPTSQPYTVEHIEKVRALRTPGE
jgi:Flp pilus assembly protein CpaB